MNSKVEIRNDAALCEEIAGIARKYLEDPNCGGMPAIEGLIGKAVADSQWDMVSKWHRVRLRLLRFQKERFVAARMLSPRESRN